MNKFLAFFSIITILVGSGLAAGETFHPTQPEANNNGISQTEGSQPGFFDGINSLLSFSGVQSTYEPGENIDVEITANTETSYDTGDAKKVVEVYKCADSSCDTPPPISSSSEDQCSSEEWYPDYDDCVAKDDSEVSFSVQQDVGTSWTWDVSFNGFQEEAEYKLFGYIWTPDQGIVTDYSGEQFTVESSDNDDSQSEPEPDPKPVIDEVDGDIPVTVEDGEITATPEFINTGDADMSSSDIVEMQVRPSGSGLLSFISNTEGTCDPDKPENVHKEFALDAGDSREISLSTSTSNIDRGEEYDVWIVTRQECGGDRAEPYGGGVIADTVYVESPDSDGDGVVDSEDVCPDTAGSKDNGCPVEPQVEQASEDIEIDVANGTVSSKISLLNTADEASGIDTVLNPNEGDMKEPNIIEMQVRPQGAGLLSATNVGVQDVCDPETPENVHKEYQIEAGDSVDITLNTDLDDLERGQNYDVWLITRQDCGGGPASPYGTGIKAGNFEYEEKETKSEICGNGVDDDGDGKVDENCGNNLPVIPVAVGSILIVLGGVYYRYG